jgi:nucleoid-associated protein YgaU
VKFNIAAIVVLIVAIIAFLAWNASRQDAEDTPAAVAQSQLQTTSADGGTETVPDTTATPPSFDIVRISPEGDAVIAGRAEPGAVVQILEGDTVIAEATADARGEWAVVAEEPIAPGSAELSLTEHTVDGETIQSESVVVLVVPERQTGDDTSTSEDALAVLIPKDDLGASKILQAPETGVGLAGDQGLTLDSIEYDDDGRFALGGRVGPGRPVMVYLDNVFVGSGRGGNDGLWHMAPDGVVEPGLHSLRVDLVDEDGVVRARIETPFARADFTLPTGRDSVVVVQPGNSLWRIARRSYGYGVQYVTIFEANRDQIGDPDLIYPGQIFLLPSAD